MERSSSKLNVQSIIVDKDKKAIQEGIYAINLLNIYTTEYTDMLGTTTGVR